MLFPYQSVPPLDGTAAPPQTKASPLSAGLNGYAFPLSNNPVIQAAITGQQRD
ncbi:hypothetical protein [Dryocola sp. BD613]|uniref:hypothetical protein n=1 Tax=Dryocola sp. BD613 TaxID=3133272 RepID=UPI003F505616